jgi:hypothetical protein
MKGIYLLTERLLNRLEEVRVECASSDRLSLAFPYDGRAGLCNVNK